MAQTDVESFRRDGFLSIAQLAGADAVREVAGVYDAMLAGEIDVTPTDNPLGMTTRQIMIPSAYHPVFQDNPLLDAAKDIARAVLNVSEPRLVFDMLIYKEPGQMATTPWHQDFAYAQMPFTPAGTVVPTGDALQFWVALDDADTENGCMHFIPGVHRGPLLEHHVAGGDPAYSQRLLAIPDPEQVLDLAGAVACPLKAGGATVHTPGTPHFTGANQTTDRPRRAYIFNLTRLPPAD